MKTVFTERECYLRTDPGALNEAILQIMTGAGWIPQMAIPSRIVFRTSEYRRVSRDFELRNLEIAICISHAPKNLYLRFEWTLPIGARKQRDLDRAIAVAEDFHDWFTHVLERFDAVWIENEIPEGEERRSIFGQPAD